MSRLNVPLNLRLLDRSDLIRLFSFGKIVDVGCSEGKVFGEKAVNVDLYVCSTDVPNFVMADAHHLPFRDFAFDCCVMAELLEHVDDPVKALEEAQRVAPVVVISVPNEHEWPPELTPFENPGHKRFYDQTSFLDDVKDSGLMLIQFIKINLAEWSHFVAMGVSKNAVVTKR